MTKRTLTLQGVCYTALFVLLFFLTYTPVSFLKIGNASPFLFVAGIVCVAFYYDARLGFIAGLISGIFCDAVASQPSAFNTIALAIIGFASGVLVQYYINKNIFSALALSGVASAVYFFADWFVSFVKDSPDSFELLLFYALPSAVYSALFIIPFYFFGKLIDRIK